MKSCFTGSITALVFLLLSCSKAEPALPAGRILINEVRQLSGTAQKLAYLNHLTATDRYTLWAEQLKSFQSRFPVHDKKHQLIGELIGRLNPNIFEIADQKPGPLYAGFEQYFHNDWLMRANKLFTASFIRSMVARIEPIEPDGSEDGYLVVDEEGKPSCDCNSKYDETYGDCYDHGPLPYENNFCNTKTDCKYKLLGCGSWLIYQCNGVCERKKSAFS